MSLRMLSRNLAGRPWDSASASEVRAASQRPPACTAPGRRSRPWRRCTWRRFFQTGPGAGPCGTRASDQRSGSTRTVVPCSISSSPSRPPSRPKPLCLTPPNGVAGDSCAEAVGDHHAGLQAGDQALQPVGVGRVDVGGQPERAVVGLGQHLRLRRKRSRAWTGPNTSCRARSLSWATSPKTVGATNQPSDRSPPSRAPPVNSVAPSLTARPTTPRMRSSRRLGDHRSHERRRVERVAHDDAGQDPEHPVHEFVVHVLVDVRPGRQGTSLTRQQRGARPGRQGRSHGRGRRPRRRCWATCPRARAPRGSGWPPRRP